ncbi:hypothetical protein DFQ29_002827 [Apophysomyces sp. BC1021]|nr:hypothetical protein DFQ29_002827 [Apophysomyces sp. BC1021]
MSESKPVLEDRLLYFTLPQKYTPGTDLMSKWILNDTDVINIIVSNIVGLDAQNEYTTRPTEWPNFTRSDVLYHPTKQSKIKILPPVLIEVQYTANMNFYRRLIEYSLSVKKQYPSMLPIVVAICIHSTTQELLNLTTECDTMPFMMQLPCHGWAKSCFLLNAESISNHLQQNPLHPLVALGHFFIEQEPSLVSMKKRDDETIQLLYSIAKRVFEDEITLDEAKRGTLKDVCTHAYNQLNMARQTLIEDVPEEASRKRTIECLDDGMIFIEELRTKYRISSSPTEITTATTSEQGNQNWQFIDAYRNENGTDMDWNQCFEAGKQKGLFKKYAKYQSVKSAYFRAKKF